MPGSAIGIQILKKHSYENIILEHDYLSSSDKLLKFQSLYFEDQLIQKNIKNIKIYNISNNQKNIKNLKITKE